MIYAVTYELRAKDRDYSPFFSYLEQEMGESAMHVLRDAWWVYSKTELDMVVIREKIKQFLSEQDVFYVSALAKDSINGWMAVSAWNWYTEHSNK